MPYYKNTHQEKHIEATLKKIHKSIYKKISKLKAIAWVTKEPVPYQERMTGKKSEINIGEKWGEHWDCAWFNFIGQVPVAAKDKNIVLLIDLNGEGCLFDDKGCPVRGITNVNSTFSTFLGEPGKRVLQYKEKAAGSEIVDIWIEAGNNDLFGDYKGNGTLKEADIAICNINMRQLYFDFFVLYDLMKSISVESARYYSILYTLKEAASLLKEYSESEAQEARKVLQPELEKKSATPSLSISAIGHAHLDLAWLWPIRETIRKGSRTFSTVLELMERYPDYVFGASQPQLYQWMKDHYPQLYKKIKEKVVEGRWEVQGGMWVEADTNIPSGESLVRQFLYGKRFFRKDFGKDMEVLWLPDVFGYTGSLPQIMKKSGVNYFMTQKLSWNEHNQFPHHTFYWQGIDGSKVLTHMLPEETYNSPSCPRSARQIEKNFLDKGISDRALMLYGIGDGGGGPGAEHLESLQRTKNLAGMAPVKQEPSIDFFKDIEKGAEKYKTWYGELYLERHQGTFTSQAENKKYNRKMEIILRDLEFISTLAMLYANYEYPQEQLEKLWKETLLYQFHDILPGSSIKRVYDESLTRYQQMYSQAEKLMNEVSHSLLDKDSESKGHNGYLTVNTLSWERDEWLKIDGDWTKISIPGLSYKEIFESDLEPEITVSDIKVGEDLLENKLLKVKFAGDGSIMSVYDKVNEREVIEEGKTGNQLAVFIDEGDAWDIPVLYKEKAADYFKLSNSEFYIDGPKAAMKQEYKYGDSVIIQEVSIIEGSRRIDFDTEVDWKESHKMLRTSFPVNVFAPKANCEIQFGNIERVTHSNTSWDLAKNEIPVQKWVDLSQQDYGVALMNNCKYGYRIDNNIIDLNLLRSPNYPGEDADKGKHRFIYSIYPHQGDYIIGEVVPEAYKLNNPLKVASICGQIDSSLSKPLINLDKDNIVVEAVKKAEDDNSIIIRLYEAYGKKTEANVEFSKKPEEVFVTDLMEENGKKLDIEFLSCKLEFKPFEIHTLKVQYT